MANAGSSATPNADDAHTYYQHSDCFVHIYAPTTVYAQVSKASKPAQHPRDISDGFYEFSSEELPVDSLAITTTGRNRRSIGVFRDGESKRQIFLEWLILKLQRLLEKLA